MCDPNGSKSGQSLQNKSSKESLSRSIQDESIKEPAKDIIEINNGQLERDTQPSTVAKGTGQDLSTEQSPLPESSPSTENSSGSIDNAKSSNDQLESQKSDPTQAKQVFTISPDIVENARLLIKTNGIRCIEQESAVEEFGFKIVTNKLAKSSYTSFYRAGYQSKKLILKKLLVSKLSKHNSDLLLNQSVKVMRCLCFSSNESKTKHFRYFIQIYEIFVLKEANALLNNSVMYIFMEELKKRTINNRLKQVIKVKLKYVKRWAIQINSAISFLQERAVAHRALRLEHILLDDDENIRITSWTRAVIGIDPISGCTSTQPKEPRARRKNHLPPEVFVGRYEPLNVDFWSLGVCLAVLDTKKFPFNPEDNDTSFQVQWTEFCKTNQYLIREDIRKILNLIFIFTDNRNDMQIRQAEVLEILNASAMETETDEHASDEDTTTSDLPDIIEDTKSGSHSDDSHSI